MKGSRAPPVVQVDGARNDRNRGPRGCSVSCSLLRSPPAAAGRLREGVACVPSITVADAVLTHPDWLWASIYITDDVDLNLRLELTPGVDDELHAIRAGRAHQHLRSGGEDLSQWRMVSAIRRVRSDGLERGRPLRARRGVGRASHADRSRDGDEVASRGEVLVRTAFARSRGPSQPDGAAGRVTELAARIRLGYLSGALLRADRELHGNGVLSVQAPPEWQADREPPISSRIASGSR